jgi:small subunit ribosomal protein S20
VANIKQQIKRNRRSLKQRERNLRYRSTIKTLYRRLDTAVSAGEGDVDERSRTLVRLIDRAASRGVIHKNSAARKKSRVARLISQASSTSGAAS